MISGSPMWASRRWRGEFSIHIVSIPEPISYNSFSMKTPNFFIIGAMKSGTTSVYEWLKQHPEIYMSPWKELNFFSSEGEEYITRPGAAKIANIR